MITIFYGADAKCGTTMVCQAVAEQLAETDKSKRVLLMHCDGKPGTEYSSAVHLFSLDDIRIKLNSKVMTGEELESICAVSENLWTLRGTESYIERQKYRPEIIKPLFEIADENFDYVLVDAGSSVDLGMSIGCLLYAGRRVLVTTQSKTAGEAFAKKQQEIFSGLAIVFNALLVNKAYNSHLLPRPAEIAAKYRIDNAGVIEISEYGIQAETENRQLSKLDRQFKADIETVTEWLYGVEKKKRSYRGLFRINRKQEAANV